MPGFIIQLRFCTETLVRIYSLKNFSPIFCTNGYYNGVRFSFLFTTLLLAGSEVFMDGEHMMRKGEYAIQFQLQKLELGVIFEIKNVVIKNIGRHDDGFRIQ